MSTTHLQTPFVIAVDAGGTHTRVACFGLDGTRVSTATGGGGAWHHDDDAEQHVRGAITEALRVGGLVAGDAVALVAGIAGISARGGGAGDRSLEWAETAYAVPELRCPQRFVNDAVTAHRGALLGAPGVVVVAGTGSMVLGIAADGTEVENGQLAHYAGGARHLAADAVQQVLLGHAVTADDDLVAAVLRAWQVDDVHQLRSAALELARSGGHAAARRYGATAPLVTAAAGRGPLADRAVRDLAERTARGALLLAPVIGEEPVRVSTTGALATDPAFTERLRDALADLADLGATSSTLVPPAAGPLVGAALMALELAGAPATPAVRERLTAAPASSSPTPTA